MNKVTRSIGASHFKNISKNSGTIEVKNILICRPNQRLGNLLLITPLVQELVTTFPDCKIDIVVKGTMAVRVFENFENVNELIVLPRKPFKELMKYIKVWFSVRNKKYDLVINAVKDSSSGKLLTKLANSEYKVFDDFTEEPEVQLNGRAHIAKNCIYNLRDYLNLIGHENEASLQVPKISLNLSKEEISNGKRMLDELVDSNKKTIAIFTFATGGKRYDATWWSAFYEKLKEEYPDCNILEVLPMENVSQINFEAPTFYCKDIREIAALIENTALFIGADSGIMHLAASTLTTTVGLFSITCQKKYGPYGGQNMALNTNDANLSGWFEKIRLVS